MKVDKATRDWLIELYKKRRISLEGNILKLVEAEESDSEFNEYLKEATEKDKETRKRRLEITKQIQERNKELLETENEIKRVNEDLKVALEQAETAKNEALKAKDAALDDLDIMQKKSQFELIGTIVRVALYVILGVGVVTTAIYMLAIYTDKDTQIIGSTWSNMFGILLTNAFSIVGTIMGVKYASENKQD
jgi:Fe2+ transport system protein B